MGRREWNQGRALSPRYRIYLYAHCSRFMATTDNRLADPVSLSGRRCTSSVLLKGLLCFLFYDSVIKCCSDACALDLRFAVFSSLDFYNVSLF